MNKTQKGFAVIETVLILVVVAIICGTGYYVWHGSSTAKKTYQNSVNVSNTSPSKSNSGQNTKANTAFLTYPYSSVSVVTYSTVPESLQSAILKDYAPAPTCIKDGKPLGGANDPAGPEVTYIPDKFAVVNVGCGIDSPLYLYVSQLQGWMSTPFAANGSDGAFLSCATLNKYSVPLTLIDKSANAPDGNYDCNSNDGFVEPLSVRDYKSSN